MIHKARADDLRKKPASERQEIETTTRDDTQHLGSAHHAVAGVASRARQLLVAAEVCAIVLVLVVAAVLLGLVDFGLRFPAPLRVAFWLIGAAGLGALAWRRVRPAWRFRPSATQVALRLENTDAGRAAGLTGLLASALELEAGGPAGTPTEEALRQRVVGDAASRFRAVRTADVLRPRRTGVWIGRCAAGLATVAVLYAVSPALTTTGALRVLAPWAGAEWPKRTGVVDAGTPEVLALGETVPLRAALTKTNREAGRTAVWVRYRVIADGRAEPWTRARLTSQQQDVETTEGARGELFERLVEPAAAARGSGEVRVEYRFETDDDESELRQVLLVAPPAVESAIATIVPPAYAEAEASIAGSPLATLARGEVALGTGLDQRAVASPVLEGSRVALEIRYSKAVDAAEAIESLIEPVPAGLAVRVDGAAEGAASDAGAKTTWRFEFDATESVRLPVRVRDRYGIEPAEEPVFSVRVRADAPPSVALTEPVRDEIVLPTALVDVVGEARDDVAVEWVSIERRVARVPRDSSGAPPGEPGEAESLQRVERTDTRRLALASEARAQLDLAELSLVPGDEVVLTATARDAKTDREPTVSPPRVLRIIDSARFVEQVQRELGGLREAAIAIDERQADVSQATRRSPTDPAVAGDQSDISDRVAQLGERAGALAERIGRNRLNDEALEDLVAEAGEMLSRAADAADEAAGALRTLPPDAPTAQEAQERVRSELARLAELLDQGQDAWVARRRIETLLERQRELAEQTAQAGAETFGQAMDQLSPEQQQTLESLAQDQAEAAQQAEDALRELDERAEAFQQADPAQASAMSEAAQQGRESALAEQMQEAAEQVGQNQTAQAGEAQQQAIEALEEMLEQLDEQRRNRDETLSRALASVIESLELLILTQESEIAALDAALPTAEFAGLDARMIRLRDQTMALGQETRAQMRELGPVADLIAAAVVHQGEAIVALRAEPVDGVGAVERERLALTRLRDALAEAERLQQRAEDRAARRAREELKRAYREALEAQVAVRVATEPLAARDLTRRERIDLRRLGNDQDAVRVTLEELREQSEDLADALVFDYAHERLATLTLSSRDDLAAGRATASTLTTQDRAARVLRSLIEALEDPETEEDFREAGGGQGQGQGQQGGGDQGAIPPIAQLKLLRAMQAEAAERTRAVHAAGAPDPAELEDVGTLQRRLGSIGAELIRDMQQGGGPGGAP